MYGILPDSIDSHTQPASEKLSAIRITFEVKTHKGEADYYKHISELANNVSRSMQHNSLDLGPENAMYDDIDTYNEDDSIDLSDLLSGNETPTKNSLDLEYSNAFELDPNLTEQSDAAKTKFTNAILEHYLSAQAAMLTGNETAIAYATATMRDHYGVDVTIEDMLSPLLEDIFLLAQANISVEGAGLPKDISSVYLTRLAETLADNTPAKIKSSRAAKAGREQLRKYKADLDNASVNPNSHLGTKSRRS